MNDQDIRKILVAYLRAQNQGCVIYEEKSIGRSICDLMMVSDRLIGFEIKGDTDDYRRLKTQAVSYDCHFDKSYIVVSHSHESSIDPELPNHWGIIVVHEDTVEIKKAASKSPTLSRFNQLRLLWRLELKNILMRNNLPIFAEKDGNEIAEYLCETLPDDVLRVNIAEELKSRDYESIYEDVPKDVTTAGPSIYLEALDTLSENAEITLDEWIDLFSKASAIREKKRQELAKTVERSPHEIPYTLIEPTLGAPWINARIISEFITYLLDDASTWKQTTEDVEYEEVTGNWSIRFKQARAEYNTRATRTYGTSRFNALYILESLLNVREIRLRKLDGGSGIDEKETLAALEKSKLIEKEFRDWIWLSEDRIWEVEEAYNAAFGSYKKPEYDGSNLAFPESSDRFTLYPYQKDAIARILDARNTLLAFDVGAGKTFIMIAAAMKMRQEGTSRRNMFVVPNNIVGQWEKMFLELYPNAKVLAVEPKNFTPTKRAKVLIQIRDGDFDGYIIAYSCFEQIQMSSAAVMENLGRQIQDIESAFRQCKSWGSQRTALERQRDYLHKLAEDLVANTANNPLSDITFDELDIETLFLDEAHNYKNLPIRTKLKNPNGINVKGSQKCYDLLQKVRHVQAYGRGAVLATGTPLCNSIADAYVFQMYLQHDELKRTHLDNFDNWVKTFAVLEQTFEIDVTASSYRMISRFTRFHNIPELMAMFSQIAIFYANTNIQGLPELEASFDSRIKPSMEFKAYMKEIVQRTEEIRKGRIHPAHDNMLKVSTDGRKAALDLRLVLCHQQRGRYSKIDKCVENVMAVYHGGDNPTQLIFCDYSTPKAHGFSVYKELKAKLEEQGVPSGEISFIHSCKNEADKRRLFQRFNDGEVRILIGSTFKLGIGANVQQRLKAVHHLDVPWRPADMVQREGRMIRFGNENESVRIYRYITEGSFDSYSWQLLERKQRFISQFLSGSAYQRTASDLEQNVLTYGEVKALALNNPIMKQLAEKENELSGLRVLALQEQQSVEELRVEVASLSEKNTALQSRIEATERNAEYVATLDKRVIKDMCADFATHIAGVVGESESGSTSEVAMVPYQHSGFTMTMPTEEERSFSKKPFVYVSRSGEKYVIEVGPSLRGNATRFSNFFKGLAKQVEGMRESTAANVGRIDELDSYLNAYTEEYPAKMQACEEEIERLKAELV